MAEGVKKYVDLRELAPAERHLLEPANTETEGIIYSPDFTPVPQSEILDEEEIRAFMRSSAFIPPAIQGAALELLETHVPIVYYDQLYRGEDSITLERIGRVRERLLEYLRDDPFIQNEPSPSLALDPRWFDYFGADSFLAWGIFVEWEIWDWPLIESLMKKEDHQLFSSDREQSISSLAFLSYLSFSKINHYLIDPLEFATREQVRESHLHQRDPRYFELIEKLGEYLGDTNNPEERAEQLADAESLLAFAADFPESTKSKINALVATLQKAWSAKPDDENWADVLKARQNLFREIAQHGYLVWIQIKVSEDMVIVGYNCSSGQILRKKEYDFGGKRDWDNEVYYIDILGNEEFRAKLAREKNWVRLGEFIGRDFFEPLPSVPFLIDSSLEDRPFIIVSEYPEKIRFSYLKGGLMLAMIR